MIIGGRESSYIYIINVFTISKCLHSGTRSLMAVKENEKILVGKETIKEQGS